MYYGTGPRMKTQGAHGHGPDRVIELSDGFYGGPAMQMENNEQGSGNVPRNQWNASIRM